MNKVKILTHKECGQCGRVRDHETEYSEETWDKLTRYNAEITGRASGPG
jgi:hypothetical protein